MKKIVYLVFALVFVIIFGCQKSTTVVPSSPENPTNTPIPPATPTATLTATAIASSTPTATATSTPAPYGKIVYQSNLDGDYDVYVYNFLTQSNTNITNSNTGYDGQPCWLANGTQIYFRTDRSIGFGGDIYVVNEDGSSPFEKVGTSDEKYYPRKGNFGTNRHLFYYKYNSSTGKYEICAWDNINNKEVLLLSNSNANFKWCEYSWLNNEIVYVSDATGYQQIYKSDVNGVFATQLTFEQYLHTQPKLSHYNNKIVYSADVNNDGKGEIYIMNYDGTNKIRITYNNDNDRFPVFSPDDYWILYVKYDSTNTNGDLYIIPATGGNEQKLNLGFSNTDETCPDWY
jgi:TolB protein